MVMAPCTCPDLENEIIKDNKVKDYLHIADLQDQGLLVHHM